MFLKLAFKSLKNRAGSALLTSLAMIVSVVVWLGVEHVRQQAKESFSSTVSGVDLIVGARTGSLNLLLYSVFHVGSATNNISWSSYENIKANDNIDWAVPISLGDSHKGFRVIGTTPEYFERFKYGTSRNLLFAQGQAFNELFDVVLGADVAKKLGYKLGDKLVLAHGLAETSFSLHDNHPFTVVGILAGTGTPVDQALHVSLQGIEAIHANWKHMEDAISTQELEPEQITAVLLGLKSRLSTFKVQRQINNHTQEPLIAILPGVALAELWQMMAILENTLSLVSTLVLVSALLGLSAMLLASLRERAHEIHLLRAIGASPKFLFWLIQCEALLISLLSFVFGMALLSVLLIFTQDILATQFGVHVSASLVSVNTVEFMFLILGATFAIAAIPAFQAFRSAKTSW